MLINPWSKPQWEREKKDNCLHSEDVMKPLSRHYTFRDGWKGDPSSWRGRGKNLPFYSKFGLNRQLWKAFDRVRIEFQCDVCVFLSIHSILFPFLPITIVADGRNYIECCCIKSLSLSLSHSEFRFNDISIVQSQRHDDNFLTPNPNAILTEWRSWVAGFTPFFHQKKRKGRKSAFENASLDLPPQLIFPLFSL